MDLYTGTLFRSARAVVEQTGDRWAILSAKHGMLLPTDKVDPYEYTLNGKGNAVNQAWAYRTWYQISQHFCDYKETVIYAGYEYRRNLTPLMLSAGWTVHVPLDGLGLGLQVQRLQRMIATNVQSATAGGGKP